MYKKVLIANRGEIAVRIIRACKEWGINTVAVHSDVDSDAMHVRLADESVCIGSHQPQNSYLNVSSLMSAVDLTGAEAIHPGYGFLSENARFAEIVQKHGIKFIGPSPDLIRKMGDKIEAKKIARENGLPIIEGSEGGVRSVEEAKVLCKKIGFPVLIKASAGGGGKGMKIVEREDQFGTIHKIGGLELKIDGGRSAGAKTFLVPEDNKDDLDIIRMKNSSILEGIQVILVNNIYRERETGERERERE